MDEFVKTKDKVLKDIQEPQHNTNESESLTFDFPPHSPAVKNFPHLSDSSAHNSATSVHTFRCHNYHRRLPQSCSNHFNFGLYIFQNTARPHTPLHFTRISVHPMAPHAEEPQPDTGIDLIQHDGAVYGDWRDDFHRNGCAIVKAVVTPERAAYYKQKQIEWLQSFGLGFDPNDESTWTQDHLPVSFKGGMYFAYASTHEKFVWEARTEPKVIEVFSKLWGTDELLSSFDGMNITLPRQKDLQWSPWPHCDQSPHRKGMQCVQGLLNYQPNGPEDGGLILMKGSSKLYDEFFRETREQDDHEDKPPEEMDFKDLFIFKEEDVKWFKDRGCVLEKINLEPGDLVCVILITNNSLAQD